MAGRHFSIFIIMDYSCHLSNATVHCCAECGVAGGASLKSCKSCMLVRYCNANCQRNHWPEHKKLCKLRAAELHDVALFKDPPPKEDCPICFLPMPMKMLSCMSLPPATTTSVPIYDFANADEDDDIMGMDMEDYSCCGKSICGGCYTDELRNKYEKSDPSGTKTLHNGEQRYTSKLKINKYHWGPRVKPIIDVTIFYVCLFGVDFFSTEWVYKTILNRRESILEELPSRRLHQQFRTRQQNQTKMQNSFDNICIQNGSGSDDDTSLVDICVNFTNVNTMHFESEVWNWATNGNRCGWMDEWQRQMNKLDDEYLRDNISFENYYSFVGDPYRHLIDTARETQLQYMVVILGATGLYWLDVLPRHLGIRE